MKNLLILGLLFLAACSKNFDTRHPAYDVTDEKQSCSFGISEFNTIKRPPVVDALYKGKPGGGSNGSGNGGGSASSSGVILLDFDGQYVSGTYWNTSGPINCAPANLSSNEQATILQRVINDFAPFDVKVTTDEAVYNAANPYKRMRVIITESWEWYGMAGGVSFLNSFTWGNNTPCFVFSTLLEYSEKKIAEACSHEAGHTFGLRHQSVYDQNGVKISDYNWGQGSGQIGWAPIMGAAYNQNLSLWHNGPNSLSSTTMQDDVQQIASVIGFVSDDYANTISGASSLSTSASGIINNSNDVDFFSVRLNNTKTISLVPESVAENNEGSDLDLVLKIYNSQGVLISTVNDDFILNAGITLTKGTYYLSASTASNQYTTKYGMLSRYTISVN